MDLKQGNHYVFFIKRVIIAAIIIMTLMTIYNCVKYCILIIQRYNNNRESCYVNSSGYYSDDEYFLDQYSSDGLLYTLISGKEIVLPSDSFFHDYTISMFPDVSFDDNLPTIIDVNELLNKEDFIELGISLARHHRTLFTDAGANSKYNYATYIFVNPIGLDRCERVVLLHDDKVNIYICDADLWYTKNAASENANISDVVLSVTGDYRVKEVILTILLFILGYIITLLLIPKYGCIMRFCLAFPTSICAWCCVCLVLLIANIKLSMLSSAIAITSILIVLLFKRKNNIKYFNVREAGQFFLLAFIISIVTSSAIVPILNTFDTYVYIYQYGNILSNVGMLDYDSVGAMAGVTSIVPALMVVLIRFFGFESIQVFHWSLLLSMIVLMIRAIYHLVDSRTNKRVFVVSITVAATAFLFVTPSSLRLMLTVNSLSYFMMFMTMLFLVMFEYISRNNHDVGEIILIGILLVVISFLRIEGAIFGAFCLFSIGSIVKRKKVMYVIASPVATMQMSYLLKIVLDERYKALTATYFFLTFIPSIVIATSMICVIIYALIFETKLVKILNKYYHLVCCIVLPIFCFAVGMVYREKFVTDVEVVYKNLTNDIWKYFPIIMILTVVLYVVQRHRMEWIDAFVIGYVFLNFGLCLGRELPLREGWGDSFNRMLSAIVPLLSYVVIKEIVNTLFSNGKEKIIKEEHGIL